MKRLVWRSVLESGWKVLVCHAFEISRWWVKKQLGIGVWSCMGSSEPEFGVEQSSVKKWPWGGHAWMGPVETIYQKAIHKELYREVRGRAGRQGQKAPRGCCKRKGSSQLCLMFLRSWEEKWEGSVVVSNMEVLGDPGTWGHSQHRAVTFIVLKD